jgi:phosphopantothenoylcysteine synthetase/decarboxylase
VCRTPLKTADAREFTTTEHLGDLLRECSASAYDAVFHAAAVSDFKFGQVFERAPDGALRPVNAGKFSTRAGVLMAELAPTTKLIAQLRGLFPRAKLFGWKYEIDGGHEAALSAGATQLQEKHTDFSVINGTAYGEGFGILSKTGTLDHVPDVPTLCRTLLRLASA